MSARRDGEATGKEARLDTYDREEWWDICRSVRPDITREEFEADWDEFLRLKTARRAN